MKVPDTSVLVAALAEWHERHADADAALPDVAVAHSLVETYSVLTRLPEPLRAPPAAVADVLSRRVRKVLTLPPGQMRLVPTTLAARGVAGGAAYDALIALTAAAHGATVITLDARALGTYARCGVGAQLLD